MKITSYIYRIALQKVSTSLHSPRYSVCLESGTQCLSANRTNEKSSTTLTLVTNDYIINMLTTFLDDPSSKFKHFRFVRIFTELTFKLKVSDPSYL